jgi:thymidylate synthase
MKNYINLMGEVLLNGEKRDDRTGTGTLAIFDSKLVFDLSTGKFPAVTTKKLQWKAVVGELLWFLSGSSNIEELSWYTYDGDPYRRTIWHPNYEKQAIDLGYSEGELGPVYGVQWRNWDGVDQIRNLIDGLVSNPHGRRHMVSAWNVSQLHLMALPPCHYGFECYVDNKGKLSLKWHQRSVDVFLGLPFNIASYALLLHILAKLTGYSVGKLIFDGGDTHIYNDHLELASIQFSRQPLDLPSLVMPEFQTLEEVICLTASDFQLAEYIHHPALSGKMSA